MENTKNKKAGKIIENTIANGAGDRYKLTAYVLRQMLKSQVKDLYSSGAEFFLFNVSREAEPKGVIAFRERKETSEKFGFSLTDKRTNIRRLVSEFEEEVTSLSIEEAE